MSYVKISKEDYEKIRKELARGIEIAEAAEADIERTLRESRRLREERDARLRRAGLLRD